MALNEGDSNMGQIPSKSSRDVQQEASLPISPLIGERLDWKFVDFTKADKSPIFEVNPITLKKFIGHNVTVVNTSQEQFHGCCLSIDPVSLSVILGKRSEKGKINVTVLPGYHLARIYANPKGVLAEQSVSVNDLDVAELYHAASLYSDSSNATHSGELQKNDSEPSQKSKKNDDASTETQTVVPPVTEYSVELIESRRNSLKDILKKHHMPFTEKGALLEIPGGVKILPPYTLESCETKGNLLIKKKLGELLNSIPKPTT